MTIGRRPVSDLRLVVVGAYVTDCIVRTPRLPAWGEELEAQSVRTSPGGKALNQAVALARLGARVTAVGVVGGDAVGLDIIAGLEQEGVDVRCLERRAYVATAVCVIMVSDTGENAISWHIDDDVAVTALTVQGAAQAMESADAVLITFEMPAQSVREAIGCARAAESLVIVQPAPPLLDRAGARALPWDLVDVLVCNEAEARALLVGAEQYAPVRHLAEVLSARLGVPTVAVTLGAAGCVAHAEGVSTYNPAQEVVAVDTTGAGDAFAATFSAQLTAGVAVAQAVSAGQAAAALAIQLEGARESMPAGTLHLDPGEALPPG